MRDVTQEEIAAWKKQHGEIFKLTVEDKVAYLKKANRKTLAFATSTASKDPMKFNEIILNNCWIEGDEEIKTEDSYFLGAMQKLAELIQVKEAELVKL